MPTFEDIEKAERLAAVDAGRSSVLRKELYLFSGKLSEVGIRPLSEDEELMALARAYRFAKKQGVAEPEEGQVIYDRARFAETIKLAFVDPESPDNALRPFFTSPVEQLRQKLKPELMAFLYEEWRLWQDLCDPRPLEMSAEQFITFIMEACEQDDPKALERFFWSTRLSMRVSFFATMASLLLSSLRLSLLSGTADKPSEKSSEKNPAPSPNPPPTSDALASAAPGMDVLGTDSAEESLEDTDTDTDSSPETDEESEPEIDP